MKRVRLLSLLLFAVMCIGLSSCNSEEQVADLQVTNYLTGKWGLIHTSGWEYNNVGVQVEWDRDDSGFFYTFKKDGSGYKGTSLKYYFEWEVNDNKLLLIDDNTAYFENDFFNYFTIKSVTSKTLVLDWEDYDIHGVSIGQGTDTFNRIY